MGCQECGRGGLQADLFQNLWAEIEFSLACSILASEFVWMLSRLLLVLLPKLLPAFVALGFLPSYLLSRLKG